MLIRLYRDTDHQDVVDLWEAVFPDAPARNAPARNIALKCRRQRELFLVAEADARIVGTTMAGYDGHRGWIYLVAVAPTHRRAGIGTALVREAERALEALGCPKVNLQVLRTNDGVVEFYRGLGFHVEERVSMGKVLMTDA